MKTLLTGSEGFIGKHVMEAYEGMVPFDYDLQPNQDMRSTGALKSAVKRVGRVIHLAALVSAPLSIADPQGYWVTNVTGTRNLLKAWSGPLFFASSAAIYDPLNPYALTKRVSENDMKGRPETSIGRFFNVFGEGDEKSVVYEFIRRALKNQDIIIYGDGRQTRSFIYVRDLVEDIFFTGGVKDFGYRPRTILDLAQTIIDSTDSKSRIIHHRARDGDPLESKATQRKKKPKYGFYKGLEITIKHLAKSL